MTAEPNANAELQEPTKMPSDTAKQQPPVETAPPMSVELRPMPDGSFDELVAEGVGSVHLEMMADNHLWMAITSRDGLKKWFVNVLARGKLSVHLGEDP